MYGDDSIAELGEVHVGIENVSIVASKAIEDRRIGLSPLEKSTRYVRFDEKVNDHYLYYRDQRVLDSSYADTYTQAMDRMFDTYSQLVDPMMQYFQQKFPKPEEVSDAAYNSSIRAKACDTLRGLLPMGTLTNMGVMGNGRAWEYLITRMRAEQLPEVQNLAALLLEELKKVIFNFLERIETEKGDMYHTYLTQTRQQVREQVQDTISQPEYADRPYVKLLDYDTDADNKIVASIVFIDSEIGFEKAWEMARNMSDQQRKEIIQGYVKNRQGRWHKVGVAFEEVYYSFEIHADLGVYKDLQRHRILSRYRQRFTTRHGYQVPAEISDAGYENQYQEAMDQAARAYEQIEKDFPEQAQYLVGHGHLGRWRVKMNLREAFHLCELRSSSQGHPNYRLVAQEMWRLIKQVNPLLGETMKYVDLADPGLERLSAEVRKEDKLKMMGARQ
jgi:thymidylate synthase ThyX